MATKLEVFDPVTFSLEENRFLLTALGKPPLTAMDGAPITVNPKAVEPVIDAVYQFSQAEAHSGLKWCGIEAIKASIETYLEQAEQWRTDRRRGAPRWPSLHTFDSRGRGYKGAVGSDSGTVRSYFTPDGQRKRFAVEFQPVEAPAWTPAWTKADEPSKSDGIFVDETNKRVECLVCGHTESFKLESRASLTAAKGRIAKHLRNAKEEPERHREALHKSFGS